MSEREYEVPNPEVEALLNRLAKMIERQTPEGFGFTLLMFNHGEGGAMFYISSAERAGMIQAMQEFVRVQKERGH